MNFFLGAPAVGPRRSLLSREHVKNRGLPGASQPNKPHFHTLNPRQPRKAGKSSPKPAAPIERRLGNPEYPAGNLVMAGKQNFGKTLPVPQDLDPQWRPGGGARG